MKKRERRPRPAEPKVYYLCDHRACGFCRSIDDTNGCQHTSDIRHARCFRNQAGVWMEQPGE